MTTPPVAPATSLVALVAPAATATAATATANTAATTDTADTTDTTAHKPTLRESGHGGPAGSGRPRPAHARFGRRMDRRPSTLDRAEHHAMTRIALLPSSYPPSLGGVEELSRHLAMSLVEAGDQVEVWTGTPDDHSPETAEILDGLLVRRLPMPLPATNWPAVARTATTGRRTVAALRRAAADFEPDVVHVQCFGPNGAYATVLARLAGVPLVVTLQGETVMDDADIFEESRVLRTALRRGLRRAADVTGCSAFTLADAEARFGLARGRGRVIPNGVDLEAATDRSAVRPPQVPGDRPYAFALGRLVAKKGFDLLVEAYAALPDESRTFDVAIAGSGPAEEDLVRLIASRGLEDRVHLLGRLEP